MSKAQRENKPLVALFAREGCDDCAVMERTLQQSGAVSALSRAVKVRVEFGAQPEIAAQYGVSATPTLLVFTPDTGYSTYVAREDGAASLSTIVALGRVIGASSASTSSKSTTAGSSKTATSSKKKSSKKSTAKTKSKSSKSKSSAKSKTSRQYQYSAGYGTAQQPYYYPQQQAPVQYYPAW